MCDMTPDQIAELKSAANEHIERDSPVMALAPTEVLALLSAAERCGELEAEVKRLREKIERDPVWFVPGKIVAHAGQCFKLRLDEPGPRIVLERVAKVTTRDKDDAEGDSCAE